jgi:hypothetical protein
MNDVQKKCKIDMTESKSMLANSSLSLSSVKRKRTEWINFLKNINIL